MALHDAARARNDVDGAQRRRERRAFARVVLVVVDKNNHVAERERRAVRRHGAGDKRIGVVEAHGWSATNMTTAPVLELGLLVCIAFASLLLNFVAKGLEGVLASRMFIIVTALMAALLAFHVEYMHVLSLALVAIGPMLLNRLLIVAGGTAELRKRHD